MSLLIAPSPNRLIFALVISTCCLPLIDRLPSACSCRAFGVRMATSPSLVMSTCCLPAIDTLPSACSCRAFGVCRAMSPSPVKVSALSPAISVSVFSSVSIIRACVWSA
ncbi:hypothetical protein BLA29_000016 [Euroglyphus maynei]|uniref:Secreted protein n=1 Tax=Euroglyphus maynei TaxID=6958 RepID=A0A1Y3AWV8_EURMA|nr:hypothetical protein BLA29_000016 [Euroglyphus maynei]